jgi:hypothetical protein
MDMDMNKCPYCKHNWHGLTCTKNEIDGMLNKSECGCPPQWVDPREEGKRESVRI